ncbi:MAG: hypothetical protein ACKO0M_03195 [Cyanobium sp.]
MILQVIVGVAEALLRPESLLLCPPRVAIPIRTASLVLACNQHELAGEALLLSARAIRAAYLDRSSQAPSSRKLLQQRLRALSRKAEACCRHTLTMNLLREARRRGLPVFLVDPPQRLYQLGAGRHGRWFSSSANARDSALGAAMARDKGRTADLLRSLGCPVPREIRLPAGSGDQQLLQAAARIGYPCVLNRRMLIAARESAPGSKAPRSC